MSRKLNFLAHLFFFLTFFMYICGIKFKIMAKKYFDEYDNECIIIKKNYAGSKGLCLIEYTKKNKGNRYVSYINNLKKIND